LDRDQFKISRLPLLPTPSSLPMSAIQCPLFQRSARGCAAEFNLCISAMNPLDLGVPALHFLADLDWFSKPARTSGLATAHAAGRSISAPRRLYHALSAHLLARSGRDLLRDDVLV